jgi:outer membrane receptor protein involved in Fe transport
MVLSLLGPLTVPGQVTSRISGTVRDRSDAVILGVTVSAEDVQRGVTRTTQTNEAGRYSFPNLATGEYRIIAELSGFKRATTPPIKIDVNQSMDLDITMEVGETSEVVTVTGAAPLLATSDSQVGSVIENKEVVDLPLAARDFMQLPLLAAGVAESTGNRRHQAERGTWYGSYSVHGHPATYNQYLFDGIPGKEASHQTNIFAPSVDAIAEIKVETANYSAEFGSEAGGHINVVTKSGTNDFHGTLFEFVRNDLWDARDSFADRKSKLRRNTFGATLGGPIRRDRTHFFVSWESMRLRQGFTQNTTVPTPAFREGDFSALLGTDASNPRPIVLYDWVTQAPFFNNVIPMSRMHPFTTRFIREFVPLPNRLGIGGIRPNANYQSLAPQVTRTDQLLGRIDHVLGPNDRIFGRYLVSDTDTLGPPVWPKFGYSHRLRGQHVMLNWSHTLSRTTIHELRVGYSRFRQTELVESAFQRDVAAEFGLKGHCRVPECWHAPYFVVQEFSVMGNPNGQTQGQGVSGPRGWTDEIFQVHDSLLIVRGKHTIRVGFTGNRYRDTFVEAIRPVGEHRFNGQWTAGPGSSGFALADALLGLPRQVLASIDIFDPNFRNSQVMPWAQDDWKVTRRLTLNLGLRYEWFGRPVARRDTISNFYQTGPNEARIITPADRPAGLGRSLLRDDKNNFAPRLGFAYQVDERTTVRGAYGVFYQRTSAQAGIGMAINPPFIRTGDVVLGVRQTDIEAFPVDDLTPVVNFIAPGSKPSISGIALDARDSYIQQWNLYAERLLRPTLVVKVGYVGTKSTGLEIDRYPNTPLPGPGDVQSRRPFPGLSSVRLFMSDGFATYHGLEATAQQRFSQGVSFLASYTWSRTIDNLGSVDLQNYSINKGLSSNHMAHRFSLAGVWEVPFGHGRRFGDASGRLVNGIFGGWLLSEILVLHTGTPLTLTTQGDLLNTGGGYTQVPDRFGDPNLPRRQRTRDRFFDTDVFAPPARYTLGNGGRNTLIGPGYRNLDLSLIKLFPVKEGKALQFRAEFFNATNHPNWGNPGTVFGTSGFGKITSNSSLPRVLQFGLKFLF